MGSSPILPHQIQVIGCSLEYRGNDATGVAFGFDDGSVSVFKNNVPAWDFFSAPAWKKWLGENYPNGGKGLETVLVHTRKATQGTPYENKNNHPLYQPNIKSLVIHNGGIYNDTALFKSYGLEAASDCDSDIIRALIDKYGINKRIVPHLNKLAGSAAVAAIKVREPGKLLLMRSNNPLVLGNDEEFLYFASDKKTIHLAARRYLTQWGITWHKHSSPIVLSEMPNNTVWLVGREGVEWHDYVSTSSTFQMERTYNCHMDYASRRKKWEDGSKKKEPATSTSEETTTAPEATNDTTAIQVVAPAEKEASTDHYRDKICYVSCYKCKAVNRVPEEETRFDPGDWECGKCSTNLEPIVPED